MLTTDHQRVEHIKPSTAIFQNWSISIGIGSLAIKPNGLVDRYQICSSIRGQIQSNCNTLIVTSNVSTFLNLNLSGGRGCRL